MVLAAGHAGLFLAGRPGRSLDRPRRIGVLGSTAALDRACGGRCWLSRAASAAAVAAAYQSAVRGLHDRAQPPVAQECAGQLSHVPRESRGAHRARCIRRSRNKRRRTWPRRKSTSAVDRLEVDSTWATCWSRILLVSALYYVAVAQGPVPDGRPGRDALGPHRCPDAHRDRRNRAGRRAGLSRPASDGQGPRRGAAHRWQGDRLVQHRPMVRSSIGPSR